MKILVIRFSSLGDVVLTTAIFPNLRARWPDAEITVLTKPPYAAVFDNNPSVDHVRLFDRSRQAFSQLCNEIREQHFDVVIDLHANPRSWFLRFLTGAPTTIVVEKMTLARYAAVYLKRRMAALNKSVRERILDCLKPLDVPVVSQETQLFPRGADDILRAHGIDPTKRLIGIAPGAKHDTKRWPAAKFADSANRLGALPNAFIVILGDKSDRAVAEQVSSMVTAPCVNLAGWTSLPELMAVVSKLSFLLTNDSGIMHIGEALKVPLTAIFGPTIRQFGFGPYRATSRVTELVNLSCRPCTLHGDDVCPLKHHQCMEEIDVSAVMFASAGILGEPEESGISS